jgi:hypothetical protein
VLSGTSQPQQLSISHAIAVTSAQITVGSVYPDNSATTVAVADLQFFGLAL